MSRRFSIAEDPTLYHGVRKRLFVGLLVCTSILVCLILFLFWLFPFLDMRTVHPALPWLYMSFIALLMAAVTWTSLGVVLNIALHKPVLGSRRMRSMTIRFFLPLMEMLGNAVGISKEKVRHSFIRVNNELVRSEAHCYPAKEILILLPHCVQKSSCRHRLNNIENCRRCGACPIDGLLTLSENYGVRVAVATGGTVARRIIVDHKPKCILAVACERDLASGIQDAFPIPVYGVLNERPNGPCCNTLVSLEQLERALLFFLQDKKE